MEREKTQQYHVEGDDDIPLYFLRNATLNKEKLKTEASSFLLSFISISACATFFLSSYIIFLPRCKSQKPKRIMPLRKLIKNTIYVKTGNTLSLSTSAAEPHDKDMSTKNQRSNHNHASKPNTISLVV